MRGRTLTTLPVFNERSHIDEVLDAAVRYSDDVLVVDDGSTDGSSELLDRRRDVVTVRHESNRGYGAALRTAFDYAATHDYDILVTIDCDGQHEPQRIPAFADACDGVDIVSASRYLRQFDEASVPPEDRRRINRLITEELNRRLCLQLTDAFCGFKAYRVEALKKLRLTENGYAMPLQLWVQAAHLGFKIVESPAPLIYLDEARSFGGSLDDAATRLQYYHLVIDRSMAQVAAPQQSPWSGMISPCGQA